MNKERPILIGAALFILVVLTALTTSVKPTNFTAENDFEELKVTTITEGTGEKAVQVGDRVKVHYVGTLKDGTQFDSSREKDQPFEVTVGVGSVIEGWDQGLIGMKLGEKRKLEIPSDLGYGAQGSGKIPANAGLVFEVELLEFLANEIEQ